MKRLLIAFLLTTTPALACVDAYVGNTYVCRDGSTASVAVPGSAGYDFDLTVRGHMTNCNCAWSFGERINFKCVGGFDRLGRPRAGGGSIFHNLLRGKGIEDDGGITRCTR